MITDLEHIESLKRAVVARFGRTLDSPTDYDLLSASIMNRTSESVSPTTLKRLFGYLKPSTVPRPSTLSALARYAGYAGWSDFCDKDRPQAAHAVRQTSHRTAVLYATATTVAAIFIGLFTYRHIAADNAATDTPTETAATTAETTETPATEETAEQKYERTLLHFITLSKERCDSVRALRPDMDIIAYREAVDSFYFPFVFTLLQDSISRQVERTFHGDELLIARYSNDIFTQCRELCAGLMREIPAEEYTAAVRARLKKELEAKQEDKTQ